ncbi:hypothetical protein APS_1674 [Acetobacter pasteurianus subsp. pasteurianus LMG 1262 = NBRC 106471]|nr:hypothetical protein APS_1674 [Acetobacter pasteurianus subsp. pasteurianus LMG 1262 = NBRC 106471]
MNLPLRQYPLGFLHSIHGHIPGKPINFHHDRDTRNHKKGTSFSHPLISPSEILNLKGRAEGVFDKYHL